MPAYEAPITTKPVTTRSPIQRTSTHRPSGGRALSGSHHAGDGPCHRVSWHPAPSPFVRSKNISSLFGQPVLNGNWPRFRYFSAIQRERTCTLSSLESFFLYRTNVRLANSLRSPMSGCFLIGQHWSCLPATRQLPSISTSTSTSELSAPRWQGPHDGPTVESGRSACHPRWKDPRGRHHLYDPHHGGQSG
jgi:hypothetical protein